MKCFRIGQYGRGQLGGRHLEIQYCLFNIARVLDLLASVILPVISIKDDLHSIEILERHRIDVKLR